MEQVIFVEMYMTSDPHVFKDVTQVIQGMP
jgi:hypothetical protein